MIGGVDMWRFVIVGILCVCLTGEIARCQRRRYDQYQLMSFAAKNLEQIRELQSLAHDGTYKLDFWTEVQHLGNTDVLVAPEHVADVTSLLRQWGVTVRTTHDNIQRLIDEEYATMNEQNVIMPANLGLSSIESQPRPEVIGRYLTYDEIVSWLDTLQTAYPDLVRLEDIGTTEENRPIKLIKIGKPVRCSYFRFWNVFRNFILPKPIIFIETGIHAREWISPAVAVYIINHLLTNYHRDRSIRALVNRFDWYILPVANPDGYVYSHTTDRLWRKNRSVSATSSCIGTDLNRNFDVDWQGENSGLNPCNNNYAGPSVFSEKESQAIRDMLLRQHPYAYFGIHSYSQFILVPWAYTQQRPIDYDELLAVAIQGRDALWDVHHTNYTVGTSGDILYLSAGTSRDWAKLRGEVKWVFGFELRPEGNAPGFLLPQDQIIPSGEETWAAIKKMVQCSEGC